MPNQTPEQKARDLIDAQLRAAGWAVQDKSEEPASVLLERIRAERNEITRPGKGRLSGI